MKRQNHTRPGRDVRAFQAREERTVHCWADGPDDDDGVGTTCMKLAEHDGPHDFVRNDQIVVRFKDVDEEGN